MHILYTALVLGLMGSFHCAGMCGPIAISLPLRGKNNFQKVMGGLIYNLGRTLTYGLMGAFFGLIGQGFHMLGFQRWISIAMGAIMVLSVIIPSVFKNYSIEGIDIFTRPIRRGIQKLFFVRSYDGLFFLGLLNGLLPCGLVYLAVAGSIGTGDMYMAMLFMVVFGLGTIPMMLFISLLGNLIGVGFRNKINRIIPYLVVVVGLIFILRGLSLGIPFLSPPKEKLTPEMHMKSNQKTMNSDAVKGACCHSDEPAE